MTSDIRLQKFSENEMDCVFLTRHTGERVYFNLQSFDRSFKQTRDSVQILDSAMDVFLIVSNLLRDGFERVENFSTSFPEA